jgi:hypothetical protein
MNILGRTLGVEFVNGLGIFLELADSRAVWCYNADTEETVAMPFVGVLLYLPFILISFGRVYDEVEI